MKDHIGKIYPYYRNEDNMKLQEELVSYMVKYVLGLCQNMI